MSTIREDAETLDEVRQKGFRDAVRWVAEYYELSLEEVWAMPISPFHAMAMHVIGDMTDRNERPRRD